MCFDARIPESRYDYIYLNTVVASVYCEFVPMCVVPLRSHVCGFQSMHAYCNRIL